MMDEATLRDLYISEGLSMNQIAVRLVCSIHKVNYWMSKYGIERRSIGESVYKRLHPLGDPFNIKNIQSTSDAILYGTGVGLYWGEGNKRNKHSIRLGNTDPGIIKVFIRFLVEICGAQETMLRYGLQVFNDSDPNEALNFWLRELGIQQDQFYKTTVTPARAVGTYKMKNRNGVLTVYFHNVKLRDIIVGLCRESSFLNE
jgi:hypothetical protein